MSDDIAIKVENLTKIYKLYNSPIDRLKESLHPLRRKYHHDCHALHNVSFEVKRGEAVGIIGKNGSGKSTLLKIITGVLTPTSGIVHVNGSISALLELGSGFSPELTGIENVYFNGMLMGYNRDEMDERLDSILAFADIGEFVYQPVKTYSSGMFVRLAFAVAVSVEPDILIVDEALSVGDVFFQQKCFDKIREIITSKTTLLFVTHSLAAMQSLCKRGILLSSGKVIVDSGSVECASAYFVPNEFSDKKYNAELTTRNNSDSIEDNTDKLIGLNMLEKFTAEQGNKKIQIIAVRVVSNNDVSKISSGDMVFFKVSIKANDYVAYPNVGIAIFNARNDLVFCTSAFQQKHILSSLNLGDEKIITIKIRLPLLPGEYTFSLGCSEMIHNDFLKSNTLHRIIGLGPLTIEKPYFEALTFDGMVNLPTEFK